MRGFMSNGIQSSEEIKHDNQFGYLLIAFCVLLLYFSIVNSYIRYSRTVLPSGDPYQYTLGWFNLLDLSHFDYLKGILRSFKANWYWLMNLSISFFSPLLIKEPFSISFVNFFMWGLASASYFRLARQLKFNISFSFMSAWLIWLFPINFGFLEYSAIPVIALDSMFMGALNLAMANTLAFVITPQRMRNAIIAGISVGLAIWGRGNSLAVVSLIFFCPFIYLLFRIRNAEIKKTVCNLLIFAAIVGAMCAFYYGMQSPGILKYYKDHLRLSTGHHWSLKDSMQFLINVPGFFFWRAENSFPTVFFTVSGHALILVSLFLSMVLPVENRMRSIVRLFSVTGAFIYFATFIFNVIFFTDPIITIYNCLLIYAPMRIGLSLCVISMLVMFILFMKISFRRWAMLPMAVFIVFFGMMMAKAQIPEFISGSPSPREVEMFAKNIDSLLDGKTISILWYRGYNTPIIRFYRIKNDIPDLNMYRNKYADDIWTPIFRPSEKTNEMRIKVREEVKKHFEEAGFIIIPEYLDYYGPQNPYAFFQFRDEIQNYLNSPESPRFVVRMILHDFGNQRLLILQRESEAGGLGAPFPLPYGLISESLPHDFKGVPEIVNQTIPFSTNIRIKASNQTGDYDARWAFDGSTNQGSFWEITGEYPFWVRLDFGKKQKILSYSLAAGEVAERMPTAWRLEGSMNKKNWVKLDEQSGLDNWSPFETKKWQLQNPNEYRYYRLYFTKGENPNILRIYEIGFL